MNDRKVLIFFPDRFIAWNPRVLTTYKGTKRALENGENPVLTTQMSFLDTKWLKDYDISISTDDGQNIIMFFTVLGGHIVTSPEIQRELRPSNNLFNLWKAGEFSG